MIFLSPKFRFSLLIFWNSSSVRVSGMLALTKSIHDSCQNESRGDPSRHPFARPLFVGFSVLFRAIPGHLVRLFQSEVVLWFAFQGFNNIRHA